ncbi:MAG TPA: twin-arginine translocase subunit TatC [Pyrinomonadaceae bacterium]|jgi:sec-independent protein translocase protein TatC|nr:twin-arginine translocase subunit TatC [Pyrinomonadaceae bacterium]
MPSRRLIKSRAEKESGEELGGQMSFLEHLDELRTRLIRSMAFVLITAFICWFVSGYIYRFLEAPVNRALAEAQQQRRVPVAGLNGQLSTLPLNSLRQNDKIRYAFPELTRIGPVSIPAGASVMARVDKDAQGNLGLFTDEPLSAGNDIVPKDVKLPIDLSTGYEKLRDPNDKLIVTTALEPFALYVKVSLYAAIGLSVPFLLWQIWAFVAPGLYPHERKYVTPFIALSSIFFVLGAATAYYLIFPPAAKYLLGLGSDFRLLLKADDYFDFIILLMLAMGVVAQMPAITYVLARMGLVTARWMLKVWRVAIITILIVAAVVSPTNDVPNMLLFAAPMFVLYAISIVVAWLSGRQRTTD